MCGLCGGRFAPRANGGPDPAAIVRDMTRIQRHRGPDDEGFLQRDDVHFGFRRLSIIDLDHGHQPISNEDGTVWVILNGEIYNFRSLRDSLLAAGHRFSTHADSEVIAHLYEDHGDDVFRHLNGMFAIAILDVPRQRLLLGRDRAGVKPLYYAQCGDDFVFASEVKALLEHPECPRAMHPASLARYLSVQYVSGSQTLFEGIRTLNPGHRLIVEAGQPPLEEAYWTVPRLDDATYFTDREACAAELRELIRDAVRLRLIADVPLGALLSGGLDSSIVVGLMAAEGSAPVKTFAVGFEGDPRLDERRAAREVASHFGTDHHEILFSRDEALAVLPQLVWHNELPVAEPLLVPSYYLFREARRHVTVVLSGEGADELFGGYRRFRVLAELSRLQGWLPGGDWPGWSRLRAAPGVLSTFGKIGSAVGQPTPEAALWEWNRLWSPDELAALLGDPGLAAAATASGFRSVDAARTRPGRAELANRLMGIDYQNRLVEFILERTDKMSMANSLELRTPFLDYRVIEFSRRIPSRWKLNAGGEKLILREAFRGLLPENARRRPKQAFQSDYAGWLPAMSAALLPDSRLVADGWLRAEPLRRLATFPSRSERARKQLWTALMLEMWYRIFIHRESVDLTSAREPQSALAR